MPRCSRRDFHTPGYSETDSTGGGFGLTYAPMNATDVRTEIGARLDSPMMVGGMPLDLRGRLAWAHDFVSNPSLGAAFQSLPGTNFMVNGAPIPNELGARLGRRRASSDAALDAVGQVRRRVRRRLADLRRFRHARYMW